MNRSVPLWFFLFCLLCWALLTVGFGWAVKSTQSGSKRSGALGEIAVKIASFPGTARLALKDVAAQATGGYTDEFIRTPRGDFANHPDFRPLPSTDGIDAPGLFIRSYPAAVRGWRLITGGFALGGGVENASLLMSPDLEIIHSWVLDEVPVGDKKPREKFRKFIHGIELLEDGSLIFSFDGGISLQRIGPCGNRMWTTAGVFSHSVTRDETDPTVWAITGSGFAEVAIDDGAILRHISMADLIDANPRIDILGLRRELISPLGENGRAKDGKWRWLLEPHHLNDVDPLPAALANEFPMFDTGDLLVSARSLNLIFVIDPDTLAIKWWRAGAVERQHDPDWLPTGEILVFNNRMGRDFSEIATISPATYERTTLYDGSQNDFYTRIRGKVQRLDEGTLIVTSPQQGRAFEVAPDGKISLEIVNTKLDSKDTNYSISEVKWFPTKSLNPENWKCPLN